MVTLKFRLVGLDHVISREFDTWGACDAWCKQQINVVVVEVESSGAAAFNRIFG